MNINNLSIPILGFAAYSGTGKTTLIKQIVARCCAMHLRVGVIKHTHHHIELEKPSKDSYQIRKSGAKQTLLVSPERSILTTETPIEEHELLQTLTLFNMAELDVIFVEGCKNLALPKIELHRKTLGKPFLFPHDSSVIAIASDEKLPTLSIPAFDINDVDGIISFIVNQLNGQKTLAKHAFTETACFVDQLTDYFSRLNSLIVSETESISVAEALYRITPHGQILSPEYLCHLNENHTLSVLTKPEIAIQVTHHDARHCAPELLLSTVIQHNTIVRLTPNAVSEVPSNGHLRIALLFSSDPDQHHLKVAQTYQQVILHTHSLLGFRLFVKASHFVLVSSATRAEVPLFMHLVFEPFVRYIMGLSHALPVTHGLLTKSVHTPLDESGLIWGYYDLKEQSVTPIAPGVASFANGIIDIPAGRDMVKPTERVTFYPIQGRIGL